jgi:hypothetical protein
LSIHLIGCELRQGANTVVFWLRLIQVSAMMPLKVKVSPVRPAAEHKPRPETPSSAIPKGRSRRAKNYGTPSKFG